MMASDKSKKTYKVVLVGESEVGKSAVTLQYLKNTFADVYEPTIEAVYHSQIVVENEVTRFDILDTAGYSDLGSSIKDQYMRQGDAFICMYSITDLYSFESLKQHINSLKRLHHCNDHIPMVLVGNKSDLESTRKITKLEGTTLARDCDCPFFETSAYERINVEDIFIALVKQIRGGMVDTVFQFQKTKKQKKHLSRLMNYLLKKKRYAPSNDRTSTGLA